MSKHGVDIPDRTADFLGPYGFSPKEFNAVQKGKCSTDSSVLSQDDIKTLATCALTSWNKHLKAHFLWTAHNEINDRWDFIKAYDHGWLKQIQEEIFL